MSSELKVPISTVTSQLTMKVTVTGMHSFRVRTWLACQLIKLAGLVAGLNIVIESEMTDQYGRKAR